MLSLLLVMLAATSILAVGLLHWNEARWRDLLGRALLAEALAPLPAGDGLVAGTRWWRLAPGKADAAEPDTETRSLAAAARERGEPLLRPGAPWESIRFAVPLPDGRVAVARLPEGASWRLRVVPIAFVAALLSLDVAVFTAFGASMLRRRVVGPLRRLAGAARGLADGALDLRVPVEGPRETAELALAFNEMGEALARRTAALEKAVVELRDSNAELRRTRAGLDRAERLASVGRLAAGVAHEVGNPMGALLALLDLAARDPALSEAGRAHLGRAVAQVERVRRILRQLLEFSRPMPPPAPAPLDLAAAAEEAVTLVRAQRRYAEIAFTVEREGDPPEALADRGAVAQILLNLLLNAGEAVRAGQGRQVRVGVRGAALVARGDAEGAACRRVPDGVECEVADDGGGIPDEDRERIFDPFFTTRDPGEGTGLGLSNSLRLAEEMGGALELGEPPPGLRTAFVLRLPAAGRVGRSATDCEVRTGLRGTGPEAGSAASEETQS